MLLEGSQSLRASGGNENVPDSAVVLNVDNEFGRLTMQLLLRPEFVNSENVLCCAPTQEELLWGLSAWCLSSNARRGV